MENETNPTPNRAEKRIELPPFSNYTMKTYVANLIHGCDAAAERAKLAEREASLLQTLTALNEAQGEIERLRLEKGKLIHIVASLQEQETAAQGEKEPK